ncbi:MAG TPA: hypothetical protein VK571_02135, partial [Gemmatimonadaceae bacterium]|nr:hypothetical protein [Gemmatimonadaceae bacterium]
MVVVLLEARFFVLDVPVVNFFGVAFTAVLVDFTAVLVDFAPVDFAPVDFAAVDLAVPVGLIAVVFETVFAGIRLVVREVGVIVVREPVVARASIRGAGFF